ncbi:hypothetical protein [Mycolicibacterium sphagni]|uniref:Uncharacterized protein n=1 Tax=Mycolicibacterium sphagni TaxID=1786 RepID=A0A255DS23_9MYCO|nr:hypothetical protein [Mycolicibacterium sphagni]MCV7179096.1 hypothetical protein [Mycolicibacterium sphagni]OYN82198.1 hypothetical protein CG716_02665 [Mycolicibacterium sphagni]
MSAAVCAVLGGCSSTQAHQEPQGQPTVANGVVASAPPKLAHLVGDQNAITFDFIYPEGNPHWTDEAKAALNDAADTLAADLVAPKPVTVTYKLSDDDNPDNLAQASSALVDQEAPGYFRTVV